ncbi:MAG: glutamate racemase [Aquabacterium sp.]
MPAAPHFDGSHTHIGVFDSGLGGLSVLRALHARMPLADISYVADSGHAPYGERAADFIVERSQAICDVLLAQQVDAIVVACNTATAAAIHLLRQRHPQVPIIGVEPGVKPAVARSARRRVGVVATPATLASDKYQRLIETHAKDALIVAQACPGLAAEIEKGRLDTPELRALVQTFTVPLKAAQVDTVVLGCTHYPFVAPIFQEALGPGVEVIDTAVAVAEHTARLCALHAPQRAQDKPASTGALHLWTSGSPPHLQDVARAWLGLEAQVQALHAEA